jgi:hypothetical protein
MATPTQEIVFVGTRKYENDPIQVTDPPIFAEKHRDTMEAPVQSEAADTDSPSRLTHRHRAQAEEPVATKFAIYDPVKWFYDCSG